MTIFPEQVPNTEFLLSAQATYLFNKAHMELLLKELPKLRLYLKMMMATAEGDDEMTQDARGSFIDLMEEYVALVDLCRDMLKAHHTLAKLIYSSSSPDDRYITS